MPPAGSYNPAITLESILLSIQLLLASPNPDDPLRDDVSDEYRYNRELFNENAKKLSGMEETKAGNSSKKMKIDNNDNDKCNTIETINEEDEVTSDNEEKPNTSDDSGSSTERVSVSSKTNRKRKHHET